MILKYKLPVTESTGSNGETIKTTEEVIFEYASSEDVKNELDKLDTGEFDLTVTVALKEAK